MRCTGKEQLTCNEEKMGCEGCFYAKGESSIEKDIEVLENLANRTYKIDKDGWETAVCSIDEQLAIRNIIARNKELEENQCCMTVCMRKDREKIFIENKIKKLIQRLEYFKNDKDISKERKEDIEAEIVDLKMLLQEGDK